MEGKKKHLTGSVTHCTQVLPNFQYASSSVCLWMVLFTYVPNEMITFCKYQVLLSDQPQYKSPLQLKSHRIKSKTVTIRRFSLEECKQNCQSIRLCDYNQEELDMEKGGNDKKKKKHQNIKNIHRKQMVQIYLGEESL